MPDAIKLVKFIKRIALEAVEAAKPVQICFGTVKSAKPLKIYVDQKMTLGKNQLIVLQNIGTAAATGSITAYAESFVGKIPYLLGAGRKHYRNAGSGSCPLAFLCLYGGVGKEVDNPYLVVRIRQIETHLLGLKGIVDIGSTKINGASDNLTLGKYEVPVFGGASA